MVSRVTILCALLAVACGPERPAGSGSEGGVLTFDAAMLGQRHDAGDRDAGTPAVDASPPPRDAGPPDTGVAEVPARFPDVPLVHIGHSDFSPLTVVTHNVLHHESSGYEEILVVVRNDGALSYCSLTFDFRYIDASGAELGRRLGTLTSVPRESYGYAVSCLLPGGTAIGTTILNPIVDTERIDHIDYFFQGSAPAGLTIFAVVAYDDLAIVDPYGGGFFSAISGRARVVSGSIRNPSITVFSTNSWGMPLDELNDGELGNFYAGTSRSFTTTGTETPFTMYLMVDDYRNAASSIVVEPTGAEAVEAARVRAAHEAWLERRRAQRPLVRP